ncbi:PAS domain S-box protein [Hydrogenovibrio sp. 3SP14C1]|uniref:PAS domain S-box protein n=1 Tax=Hydrogenovibrio sp. 3SP14C1 TaxID=3038774 RepID=UPI002417F571|nr:PAS domain S-box protein [Hydrogenovibrio sp. 3SP14C1]MDG4813200.1 PAS domain S-box protein [Hydrogenovibrio sp. 3SP14C1]
MPSRLYKESFLTYWKQGGKVFALTFGLGILVVWLFISVYLSVEAEGKKERIQLHNQYLASAAGTLVKEWAGGMVKNVMFLAEETTSLTQKNNSNDLTLLKSLYFNFIHHQNALSQIRYINNAGQEAIRFNKTPTGLVEVSPENLQDKSLRYYFKDAAQLKNGQLAISRLDLNFENNRIEIPIKPTLRISSAIFNKQGKRIGVLVVNFLVQDLLDQLSRLKKEPQQQLWIVNQRMDWVLAPPGQKILGEQQGLNQDDLFSKYPKLAGGLSIGKTPSSLWHEGGRLIYVHPIRLIQSLAKNHHEVAKNRSGQFYVITEMPDLPTWLSELLNDERLQQWVLQLIVLIFLFALVLGFFANRSAYFQRHNIYQKKLFDNFFNRSPNGLFLCDQGGEFVFQNKAGQILMAELALNKVYTGFQFYSKSSRRLLWQQLSDGNPLSQNELTLKVDRKKRCFKVQCFLMSSDNFEAPLLAAVFYEITQLTEAQQKLKDREQQVRALLDSAPDGILLSDAEGKIYMANQKAQQLFDMTSEDFLDATIETLVPDAYREHHKVLREQYFKSPKERMMAIGVDFKAQKSSGLTFDAEISLSPIMIKGEQHVISIIRDITERKKLENDVRQSQKMDALGKLTGNLAHDFNNFLTTIIGNLDLSKLLLEQPEIDKQKLLEKLNAAVSSSEKAAKLTRRLLTFSRQQPVSEDCVLLLQFLEEESRILKAACGKLVEFTVCPEVSVWPVLVNRDELMTAMLNLLTNAQDAMPDGGQAFIDVENYMQEDKGIDVLGGEIPKGDYVILSVSDTGCGIETENLNSIFEPFFTTKPKNKGTGFGLAQVFSFMKQSKGFIKLYSEPGIGSTFQLFFPRDESKECMKLASGIKDEKLDIPSPITLDESFDPTQYCILVVDDDVSVRALAVEYLEKAGYHVEMAYSADNAMSVLKRHPVDLMLTDVVMPEKNGFELANMVESEYPNVDIIFSSGFPKDILNHARLLKQKMVLLDKPYRKSDLLSIVQSHLISRQSALGSDSKK